MKSRKPMLKSQARRRSFDSRKALCSPLTTFGIEQPIHTISFYRGVMGSPHLNLRVKCPVTWFASCKAAATVGH